MERYEHLSIRLLHLVEVAFVSEERYQLALKLISELEKSLLDDPENRERQPRLLSFDTQTSQCANDLFASQFGPLKEVGLPKKVKEFQYADISPDKQEQRKIQLINKMEGCRLGNVHG
ncbi:hypothetical protein HPP92_024942 [Vanilla planifolia]|uniref:Uncharacterized protein n=1 Tax=Vanilla planifolia TaxID=51239 RepID=A0A835U9X9_VANPL|nr:hypothetical protein HPP92_024942 [Vanilla planifolia]